MFLSASSGVVTRGDLLLVCDFVFCVERCCYSFFVVVISFLHRLCVQVVCFCFGDVQWCNGGSARLTRDKVNLQYFFLSPNF